MGRGGCIAGWALALCVALPVWAQVPSEVGPIPLPPLPLPPTPHKHPPRPPAHPPQPKRPPEVAPLSPVPLVAPPPDLSEAGREAAERSVQAHAWPVPDLEAPRFVQAPDRDPDDHRRVAALIAAGLARDRVTRGLIDPYFSQVRHSLERAWDPEPAVEEKGLKGFFQLQAEKLRAALKDPRAGYLAQAAQYGAGLPHAGDEKTEAAERLFQASEASREANSVTKVALVELTQGGDGRLLGVRLVRPSDDPAMDAELMRELRSGHTELPTPPEQGRFISERMVTLWEYQLDVFIAPPAPVIYGHFEEAALFDPKLGPVVDVVLPLQRRITKHVELLEVR